jgi:iron complex outermembrane receptor protein
LSPRTTIDVFCNNLFDKYIETKVFNALFFVGPRPFSTVLPPRNYGIRPMYRL